MWKGGNEMKDEERTLCEIFTRVMGYFRPVSQYNTGKKQEFKDRRWFSEKKIADKLPKKSQN